MKKLLFILFLFGFANAQVKRIVEIDSFNTIYLCDSGRLEVGNMNRNGAIYYNDEHNYFLNYSDFGWNLANKISAIYIDTLHTISNPFEINSGQLTTFVNNGNIVYNYANGNELYNISDTLIVPTNIGDIFCIAMTFTIHPADNNAYFIISMGAYADTRICVKGAAPQTFTMPFFTTITNEFIAGDKIKIESGSDANIYNISYNLIEF